MAPPASAPLIAAMIVAGVSMRSETGRRKIVARIVSTAYRLASVMFSPTPLFIVFFARIARSADETFERIAAQNPSHVNESSLSEASATPPTIGSSVAYVIGEYTAPSITADRPALTTGSDALIMCVNETAPAPSEITAPMCVPRWPSETGTSVLMLSVVSFGALRSPVAHSAATYGMPTKSCSSAIVHGIAIALSAFLL